MRKITVIFLFALCGLSFQLKAEKIPMDIAIKYGKLDNGITYYIKHNEKTKERAESVNQLGYWHKNLALMQ